jgi:4-hydroxy-3-polyprenylbenzoate decarboxylase
LYAAAEAKGQPLPVSVSIGFDPATAITASSHRTITPIGFDELSVAGGLLGSPIEVVKCKTVDAEALARAEIVLEGEIMPKERLREDSYSKSGNSMADFAGHHGTTDMGMPVVKVRAITHRQNPIFQTIITPGEEVNNLLGVPAEAGVLQIAQAAAPGNVVNAYAPPSGGGKLVVVVQVVKKSPIDDGVARQVALVTLSSLNEIKHVVLVDEDVDIFDPVDVFWAMTTRFQANTSLVLIPGVDGHQLDQSWRLQPAPRAGLHCKAIFDCTVPYELKGHFRRPKYLDVDVNEYALYGEGTKRTGKGN